jgi:hypothetical protein
VTGFAHAGPESDEIIKSTQQGVNILKTKFNGMLDGYTQRSVDLDLSKGGTDVKNRTCNLLGRLEVIKLAVLE